MPQTRWSYYQNIKYSHPDLYWNNKTQMQMLKEQKLLGNAFYEQYEFDLEVESAVG